MATEAAGGRAAGETGWVERARRGFDEMRSAAQRHEWEQLAVAPTGEGAHRVVSEAMRPLQLQEMCRRDGAATGDSGGGGDGDGGVDPPQGDAARRGGGAGAVGG
eukprot:4282842-Prymnesium_polylepis.1